MLCPPQSVGRSKKCLEGSSLSLCDGYRLAVWTCWQSFWTLKHFLPPVPIPEISSFFLLHPLFNPEILLMPVLGKMFPVYTANVINK